MSKKTTPAPAIVAPARLSAKQLAAAWNQAKTAAGKAKHLADAKTRTRAKFATLAKAMEANDHAMVKAFASSHGDRVALVKARKAAAEPAKAPTKAKSRKAGAKAPAKAPAGYPDIATAALAYAGLCKAGAADTPAAAEALAFITRA